MLPIASLVSKAVLGQFGPAAEVLKGLAAGEAGVVRRAVVKAFLPDLLRGGVSGRGALGMFRRLGFGIRTGDFFRIRKSLENVSAIAKLAGDARISADLYTPTDYKYPGKLTARVKVFYRDTATGRYASKPIFLEISEGETNEEIIARAMENIEGYWKAGRGQYWDVIYSLTVEEILERED